jgi:hypothetical protein
MLGEVIASAPPVAVCPVSLGPSIQKEAGWNPQTALTSAQDVLAA